jgi:hypothetical protein
MALTLLFRSSFDFGLPRSELDFSLCWYPDASGDFVRRVDPESRTSLFPSWSWAGWKGPVAYNKSEAFSRIEWVDDEGCVSTTSEFRKPDLEYHESSWLDGWERKESKHSSYYFEKSDPDVWYSHPVATENERPLKSQRQGDAGQLRFWAQAIDYKFQKPLRTELKGPTWQVPISNKDGDSIGSLWVPAASVPMLNPEQYSYDLVTMMRKDNEIEATHHRSPETDKVRKMQRDKLIDQESSYDDLQDITLHKQHFPDEPTLAEDEWTPYFYIDRQKFDIYKPYSLYEVLMIEWRGDVAYRVGNGHVHIDGWAQAAPKRKLIILE